MDIHDSNIWYVIQSYIFLYEHEFSELDHEPFYDLLGYVAKIPLKPHPVTYISIPRMKLVNCFKNRITRNSLSHYNLNCHLIFPYANKLFVISSSYGYGCIINAKLNIRGLCVESSRYDVPSKKQKPSLTFWLKHPFHTVIDIFVFNTLVNKDFFMLQRLCNENM